MNANLSARNAVSKAVKDGRLVAPHRLLCVDCGDIAQHYDHRDYTKPLAVDPVCRKCNLARGKAANSFIGSHDSTPLGRFFQAAPRGSMARLSETCGVTAVTVTQWSKGLSLIGVEHMAAIERFTAGAVSRKTLRPDDWMRIWPELAATED